VTTGASVLDPGATTRLSAAVTSVLPTTLQWYLNGVALTDATTSTYTIANFSASAAGRYSVTATNEAGSTVSANLSVTAPLLNRGRLINASVRSQVRTGDATLIVGVTLGGNGTGGGKPIVVRAVGPTLATFGVTGTLSDPMITMYDATDAVVAQNDDWAGTFDFGSIGGFPFSGTHPKDAAIYNPSATNGRLTMHVTGKPGDAGMVLAEVYDATAPADFTVFTPRLINCSVRSFSDVGDNVLILGFVVDGSTPEKVLIRAAGPTLSAAPFNISGMLADPKLEVYKGSAKLAENDNWEDNGAGPAMNSAFASVSAFTFRPGSKDAGIVLTLPAGSYSALVRGVNDTTGIALVELYELPQ
jgi:hypothetical protein